MRHDLERGQDAVRVGADREERRVAEVEQPGKADDDVEAERERGIGGGVGRGVDIGVVVVNSGNAMAATAIGQRQDLLAA